jgi:hypothetical protein
MKQKIQDLGNDYAAITKDLAIHYAEDLGWCVIPVHNPESDGSCSCNNEECDQVGKHPRISAWTENCTTDVNTIEEWFKRWPNTNIGIATGAISGVIVLDVDNVTGKRVLSSLDRLPYTRTAKSSKGIHYYFKHPGVEVKNGVRILPGIDSRGDGGFVVAPPSLHSSGNRYEWLDKTDKIAEAPEWWLELTQKPMVDPIKTEYIDVKIDDPSIQYYGKAALENELSILWGTPIGQGLRNGRLNNAAFALYQLVAGGVLEEKLVDELLYEAASKGMKMSDKEIRSTLGSGKRAGLKEPRRPKPNELYQKK